MKRFIIIAATALCLSACNDQMGGSRQAESERVPIQLGAAMDRPATRANSQAIQPTELVNGAAVGVYIYPKDSKTTTGSYGYKNVSYTVDGAAGNLALVTAGDQPYYPENKTVNVDIYAFAPRAVYTEAAELVTLTSASSIAFSTQADQTSEANYLASDFIWGAKTNVTNGTTTTIDIPLAHKLSKINVNIAAGNGVSHSSLAAASITLADVNHAGLIDLTNGSVTTTGSTTGTLTLTSSTSATGTFASDGTTPCYTASAVLIPQTITAKTLTITLANGSAYTFSLTNTFAANTVYTYDITVAAKALTLTTTITDWTTGAVTPGTAE